MPYYFVARGWSYDSGKIYPEGTQGKLNFFTPVVAPGTPTWINSVDVSKDTANVVEPKWQASRNLWENSVTYAKDFTNLNTCDYFGNMLSPDATPWPGISALDLGSWRIKPKVPKKVFMANRAAGKVVVNPLDVYAASATVYPGLKTDYLTAPMRLIYKRSQYRAFPVVYSPVFKRYGWQFPSMPGNTATDTTTWHSNVWSVLDRYYMAAGAQPWYIPSDAEVWDMAMLVRDAVETERNTGLITATLAEANNKNWDILTELAEAPEAIRYILGVLQQVLRLCKDFRNEVTRLRKEYYRRGGGRDGWHDIAITDILAQKWLEFRYAIMPLIYSSETAIKYLLTGEVEYQTTRKGSLEEITLDHPDWEIPPIVIRHRCFIKRRFSYDKERFSSNSSFLTMNPLSTAWELTTLSFIVDWAVNVGDFLTSLVPPQGIIDTGAIYSTQLRPGNIVLKHKRHLGAEIHLNIGRYIAEPIHPPAHIGLTVQLDLNWKRALDSLSLMWQVVKKR